MTESSSFAQWGILEIFGHQQWAGWITSEQIGGSSFVRIDVPAAGGFEPCTKYFGTGSIFALHPCSEQHARQAAERLARHGNPLPVATPDLSAAQQTIEEARAAARWLREQREQIAAALQRTAEDTQRQLLAAAPGRAPWQGPTPDFETVHEEEDDELPL
jgi:hypothetical protein